MLADPPLPQPDLVAAIPRLRRYARVLTGDATRADDLVQETLARGWEKRRLWAAGTDLRAWLFTILHNTARNRARDDAREHVDVDSEAVERAAGGGDAVGISAAIAETPESILLRDTLTPDLQAALDALPPPFREAVWLRDVEEFSYAEIAQMLSIPVGTVMSRISRGRRQLFDRLHHLRPAHV